VTVDVDRRFLDRLHGRIRARVVAGLRRVARALRSRGTGYPVLSNVNRAARGTGKRALLLYRLKAFLLDESDPRALRHHNLRRNRLMAAVLGELGYIVDVAKGRDARLTRPDRGYEVVVSDRVDLRGVFPQGATKILFATSANHILHNRNLRRRHERLAERRRPPVQIRRTFGEAMPYAARADAIAALGNEVTAGSWREVGARSVVAFNNHGFPDTEFVSPGKDFGTARRHFLYYAGQSQVQKGLDLLLEVFPRRPDLHLYVCSAFESEPDFCEAYRKELYETPNVHPVGWVQVNGPQFLELTRRCASIVHPSCSDGQASAVVQCMHAGLIPLVTRETGIDSEDVAVTLADDSLAEIEGALVDVARRPVAWHEEQSGRTRQVAEARYSEEAFRRRWRALLEELLAARPSGAPRR
jgi:glycosyltransferase involved in cell wall biosynthesis